MGTIRQTMNFLDWAMFLFLSVSWGASFIFVEIALQELPVLSVVAVRITLGAFFLMLYVLFKRHSLRALYPLWRSVLFMGCIAIVVPFCLLVWGQVYVTAGLSSTLNATTPFFTVILAHFFTRDERMNWRRGIAVFIAFIGVLTIMNDGSLFNGNANTMLFGQIACMLAALCYGGGAVYARRFKATNVPPVVLAMGQLICATLFLLPIALIVDQPWTLNIPSLPVIGSLVGIGLFSTAIAFVMYYHMIARVGATNMTLVTLVVPVVATVFGIILFSDLLLIRHIIGMWFIAIGFVVIDGRLLKIIRKK